MVNEGEKYKVNDEFEQAILDLENVTIDKHSLIATIERIKDYIKYYEMLLQYTKHSVKRKKAQEELTWWRQDLVVHEDMLEEL